MDKLISLCMIVKNEEKVLARCLDSVRDIVDEMIIVDTGSADRTKEIALQYTPHVYDYKWNNDFSAAKNEAIRHAAGKWILVLDADEYMDPIDARGLRRFLEEETPNPGIVYCLPIINFLGKSISNPTLMEGYVDRVFPNHMGIRFHRPIHEQLMSDHGHRLRHKHVPFRIYHTGYLQETVKNKDKSARNMAIFEKLKQSGKMTPYDYFTLGNELQYRGEFEEAHDCYRKGLSGAPRGSVWYSHCLFNLILCTLQLKRIEETWELIEKELSYYREYPEYSFMKAIVYQYFAFYGLAEQELWNAIQAAETLAASNRDFWLISPDYGNVTPYQNLAGIYLRRKDLKRAIECFTRILKIRPYDLASLVRLMGLLSFREPADAILSFLGKLYPEQSETDRTLIYYAALHVGNRDLLDHVEPTLPETIQLTPAEVLRAALVRQDEEKFRKTVSTLSPKQLLDDVTFKHLMLGVLIWHTADWLERADMSSHEFYPRVRETVLDLLEGRLDPQMLEDAAVRTYLCTLLTELFNLGHYEAYDQWVNRLTHPMVIDYLANFFYSRNQLDIAVNYFSLLLRETDDLPNETLESLFFMHLNENLVEDGLGFLRHAIDKDPDKVQYYTLYCLYARDPSEKREMKSQLLQRFPQYGQLPFIRNL